MAVPATSLPRRGAPCRRGMLPSGARSGERGGQGGLRPTEQPQIPPEKQESPEVTPDSRLLSPAEGASRWRGSAVGGVRSTERCPVLRTPPVRQTRCAGINLCSECVIAQNITPGVTGYSCGR